MKNAQYSIYFDMDGVLTDFDKRYYDFFGIYPDKNNKEEKNKSQYYDLPKSFWSKMEWIKGGKELFNFCYTNFSNLKILSSVGIKEDLINKLDIYIKIKEGKLEWLKNNIPQIKDSEIYIVPSSGIKAIFSSRNRIIIDDKFSVIKLWKIFGGIGILHDKENFEYSIEQLKSYLL